MEKQRTIEQKQMPERTPEEEDDDDDSNMEAGYDEIEQEEFRSGVIAEKEDEEELEHQRREAHRKKWKRRMRETGN